MNVNNSFAGEVPSGFPGTVFPAPSLDPLPISTVHYICIPTCIYIYVSLAQFTNME